MPLNLFKELTCFCACIIIGAIKIELNSGYRPVKIATTKFLGPVEQAVGPGTKCDCHRWPVHSGFATMLLQIPALILAYKTWTD